MSRVLCRSCGSKEVVIDSLPTPEIERWIGEEFGERATEFSEMEDNQVYTEYIRAHQLAASLKNQFDRRSHWDRLVEAASKGFEAGEGRDG